MDRVEITDRKHVEENEHHTWSELPCHLLFLIINKLINNIVDYIRFGAVCRSWQSAYTQNLHNFRPPPQLPLLMLTTELDHYQQTRSLYSLSKSRLSNFRVPLPHDKACRGSSHGWLVIVDKISFNVHLFNPFLSGINEIQLPPLTAFEQLPNDAVTNETYLVKVVLSASPASNPDYVVMALYGSYNRLAFFKPGDKTWISVGEDESFANVVYYRDQFYAVNRMGALYACDLNYYDSKLSMIGPPIHDYETSKIYLVESSGDLLQVKRKLKYEYDSPAYSTTGFEVFKLDYFDATWFEVESLFGQVLFLGNNSSISLSASDFLGCEPNCIYFTDDNYNWYDVSSTPDKLYDTGVFNMETGSVDRHYAMKSKMKFPPPIWVEPTPRRCFD